MSHINFCGEVYDLSADEPFRVGREGDLAFDDNPYLHRTFLVVTKRQEMWWLDNVGNRIAATVSDPDGRMQAWLAPGAALPLVFERTMVLFTAGPTTYEFEVVLGTPAFTAVPPAIPMGDGITIGNLDFTTNQLMVMLALAEPTLRREGWGGTAIPTSAQAAKRLDWPITRFNRALDHVCDRLTKLGVKGLHGGPEKLAVDRRARLVEYAVAARWVSADHLRLLDLPQPSDLA